MNDGRHASLSKLPSELLRRLTPKRRELVRPIFDRPLDYVLLSIRKLAATLDADAMAILRTIRSMGFDGYGEFRLYLHELALVQATQLDPMQPRPVGGKRLVAQLRDTLARDASHLSALRQGPSIGRVSLLVRKGGASGDFCRGKYKSGTHQEELLNTYIYGRPANVD